MIHIIINDAPASMATSWDEISCLQAQQLLSADTFPEQLAALCDLPPKSIPEGSIDAPTDLLTYLSELLQPIRNQTTLRFARPKQLMLPDQTLKVPKKITMPIYGLVEELRIRMEVPTMRVKLTSTGMSTTGMPANDTSDIKVPDPKEPITMSLVEAVVRAATMWVIGQQIDSYDNKSEAVTKDFQRIEPLVWQASFAQVHPIGMTLIERFCQDKPKSTPPPSWTQRLRNWLQRKSLTLAADLQ